MKTYYVYIMASISKTLYVGMTGFLERRMSEHRGSLVRGFSSKYKTKELVYYEIYDSPLDAIAREKQIKAWRRAKKVALIESVNPRWRDLARY